MVASCEIYEPDRDRWTVAPRLGTPRQSIAITTLHDGRVLAIGGRGHDRVPLTTVEICAPGEPWKALAPLTRGVWGATALIVDDSRALVLGGFDVDGPTRSAWWIDRRSGAITPAPPTRHPHSHQAVGLSPEGRPVVAGGYVERLDGNSWREIGGIHDSVDGSGMARLTDGRLMLAGGRDLQDAEAAFDECGLLAAGKHGFQFAGRMSRGRWGHLLAALGDEVLAVGGLTDHRRPRFVEPWEIWSSDSGWRPSPFRESRFLHAQVALPDGSWLVIGGVDDEGGAPGSGAIACVSRVFST